MLLKNRGQYGHTEGGALNPQTSPGELSQPESVSGATASASVVSESSESLGFKWLPGPPNVPCQELLKKPVFFCYVALALCAAS